MASKSIEKIVEKVSILTVLELSELVEALQKKLGVSAMPKMAAAPAGAAAGDGGEEAPAGAAGGGTVILTGSGDNKIAVIKALREINQNWGLRSKRHDRKLARRNCKRRKTRYS